MSVIQPCIVCRRKEQAEQWSCEAKQQLRAAEEAYSAGCDSLSAMRDEFGEARIEVEMALERTEATLLEANRVSNAALREYSTHHMRSSLPQTFQL